MIRKLNTLCKPLDKLGGFIQKRINFTDQRCFWAIYKICLGILLAHAQKSNSFGAIVTSDSKIKTNLKTQWGWNIKRNSL